jgi:hypothetical protein
MSDEELKCFLPRYGDRLGLRGFLGTNVKRKPAEKMSLLQKLNYKLQKLQDVETEPKISNSQGEKNDKNAFKASRTIEFGLMNFNFENKSYVTVRTKKGDGVRKVKVSTHERKRDLIKTATALFCHDGQAVFGPESDYDLDIYDFKQIPLREDISVQDVIESTKLQKIRFYLALKRKALRVSKS